MKNKSSKLHSRNRDDDEPVRKKKKRPHVEDEAPKKKFKERAPFEVDLSTVTDVEPKKKKPGTGLVVAKPEKLRKKKKGELENPVALNSEAKKLYRKIQDDETAGIHIKELANMLRINARLIRSLYAQLEKSINSRDIYALSALMSQQREVIADIRTVTDMGSQVENITRGILQPAAQDQAGVIVNMFYQLRRLMAETSHKDKSEFALNQLEKIMTDVAQNSNQNFVNISTRIRELLTAAN